MLARELNARGARVTLLMGPVAGPFAQLKNVRVIKFRFYQELKKELFSQLQSGNYDIAIHSAAVSDYILRKPFTGKLSSAKKSLHLRLVPAEKLISSIKKISKNTFVVGFKFEPSASEARLFREASMMIRERTCDAVVANTLSAGKYRAYIAARGEWLGPLYSKKTLAFTLVKSL